MSILLLSLIGGASISERTRQLARATLARVAHTHDVLDRLDPLGDVSLTTREAERLLRELECARRKLRPARGRQRIGRELAVAIELLSNTVALDLKVEAYGD